MAVVKPFRAVRPAKENAESVVALPYDVMNRKEAAQMAAGNPCSFLHISRAEIDLPEVKDPYDKSVYEKAKENIETNLRTGVLIEEEAPTLYIYRQQMNGRHQTGIVGCVSIDDYKDNIIKKHEFTRVEKEIDRINHFDVCNTNTEPVFLTYRDNLQIRTMIEGYVQGNEPEYDFVTKDGVGHTLWVIEDDSIVNALCQLFDRVPDFYIADGHHRSASACKVGELRRNQHPDYTGEEEFNFFMAVIFPDKDLRIYDYNRVVKDLAGYTKEEFLKKIEEAGFIVTDEGSMPYRPDALHEFSMYLEGHWYKLVCEERIVPDDIIEALDVSILQRHLLGPILKIEDPRIDQRIDFVGGIRGLKELERRASLDMKVAFAVYPVSMEELMNIADHGEIMPPKSTWFEPKIGSGLFMHRL